MKRQTTKDCPKCGGTGRVIDDAVIGAEMRALRERSGKSLRAVAGKLKLSPAYLSDLELGQRRWSPVRIEQFKREVSV